MIFFDNKLELMNTIMIIIIIIFLLFYFVGAYFKSIENFSTSNVGPYNIVTCPPQFEKQGTTDNIYYNKGNVGIGTDNPQANLHVTGYSRTDGILCVNGGILYGIDNNHMDVGSLAIGSINKNYGVELGWSGNTAGLLLECTDNTEIAVHDSGDRLASLMYYEGADINTIHIGRNKGWGVTNTLIQGNLNVDGALSLTGSPSNPGNTVSASFWNQAGLGPTISGNAFSVQTNGTTEALGITNTQQVLFKAWQWHGDNHWGQARFYFEPDNSTYIRGHGTNYNITFRNKDDQTKFVSYHSGSLWIHGALSQYSDSRIKKNITDIQDKEALNKLLLIEPKKYEYIDPARGTKPVIGFIAQQVREILPEAVDLVKKLLPNVMQNCNCDKNKIFININDIQIGNEINIKYNGDHNNETGQTFKVKEITTEYILLDDEDGNKIIPENITECFVYGYEVDDAHILTKEYIYALNVSATQELYKIIMEQQNRISKLEEILARNYFKNW